MAADAHMNIGIRSGSMMIEIYSLLSPKYIFITEEQWASAQESIITHSEDETRYNA